MCLIWRILYSDKRSNLLGRLFARTSELRAVPSESPPSSHLLSPMQTGEEAGKAAQDEIDVLTVPSRSLLTALVSPSASSLSSQEWTWLGHTGCANETHPWTAVRKSIRQLRLFMERPSRSSPFRYVNVENGREGRGREPSSPLGIRCHLHQRHCALRRLML